MSETNIHSAFNACMFQAHCKGLEAENKRLRAGLETLLQSDGTWRSTDDAMRAIEQRVAALLAADTGAQANPK